MGWLRRSFPSLGVLLLWGPLLIVGAAAILLWWGLSAGLQRSLENQFETLWRERAELLALWTRSVTARGQVTPELLSFWSGGTDVRIDWIPVEGAPVSNRDGPPPVDRPEVLQARARGVGVTRTASATPGTPRLHIAVSVGEDWDLGVLRVSPSLLPIREAVSRNSRVGFLLTALAGAASLVVGVLVRRRVLLPVRELRHFTGKAAEGDAASPPAVRSRRAPGEIVDLSEEVDRLVQLFTSRLQVLSGAQAQLLAVLSTMTEGMVVMNPEHRVHYINEPARQMLGIQGEVPPGANLWELVRSPELEDLLRELPTGASRRGGVTLLSDSGETHLRVTVTCPKGAADGRRELLLVLEDVTDLRRVETLRRDFVASVSHELKTPLTSISGYVETLLDGGLDDTEKNVRFVEKIRAQAERLTRLVSELMELARVESQKDGVLELVAVDCARLVGDVLEEWGEKLRERRHRLVLGFPPRAVLARSDPGGLSRILNNLLANAIAYTPPGGEIGIRVVEEDGRACILVEDNGAGIPEQELGRIFERFYRGTSSRVTEVSGSGLGLSIVKHLVSALDGDIVVDSQVGKGSRFTVRLPLV